MALLFDSLVPANIRAAFAAKVRSISTELGIDPDWLMFVMRFESGINPQAINPSGGATGLIQFMPDTAASLGTTTGALYRMGHLEQLDWVRRYYLPYKGYYRTFTDLYLATFYPYALVAGKPDSYVFGSERGAAWQQAVARQNPVLDTDKNGAITLAEWRKALLAHVDKWVPEGLRYKFKKKGDG